MTEKPPQCEYWSIGNITTDEPEGPQLHERAILVTFKTIEEYRAALRYMSPVIEGNNG